MAGLIEKKQGIPLNTIKYLGFLVSLYIESN